MNGRINTNQRRKLVPLVRELAVQVQMPFNFVNGAILWKGERVRRPVTQAKLAALVKAETLLEFEQRLIRKAAKTAINQHATQEQHVV